MELYKKTLDTELKYEEKLLKHCETNELVKNKEFCKKRIQKRIELINAELIEEIEEPEAAIDNEETKVEKIGEELKAEAETETSSTSKSTEVDSKVKVEGKIEKEKSENKENNTISESVNVDKVEIKEKDKIEKPIEINQELYDEIYKRADEYKEAKDYFVQVIKIRVLFKLS